ncbi:MAG: MFS transporter, partial [Sphingomonadaceae bacterium]
MAETTLDVVEAIDCAPIGRLQIRVFILCALVAMLDGFDTQSIAFVAPVIAESWGFDGKTFGPIFSAALAGLMIGQLVLSLLSDRIGRR